MTSNLRSSRCGLCRKKLASTRAESPRVLLPTSSIYRFFSCFPIQTKAVLVIINLSAHSQHLKRGRTINNPNSSSKTLEENARDLLLTGHPPLARSLHSCNISRRPSHRPTKHHPSTISTTSGGRAHEPATLVRNSESPRVGEEEDRKEGSGKGSRAHKRGEIEAKRWERCAEIGK
ncbi:hypothetical protein T439DRAFT_132372 [Meredithblackwellia eburnea MCA 4105]